MTIPGERNLSGFLFYFIFLKLQAVLFMDLRRLRTSTLTAHIVHIILHHNHRYPYNGVEYTSMCCVKKVENSHSSTHNVKNTEELGGQGFSETTVPH